MAIVPSASLLLSLMALSAIAGEPSAPTKVARRTVSGTRLSLAVPDACTPAHRFVGFECPKGTLVIVAELPAAAISEFRHDLPAEGLKAVGLTQLSRIDLEVDNSPAVLFGLEQRVGGAAAMKWELVVGSSGETVVIVAQTPAENWAEFGVALRALVLSATIAGDASGGDMPPFHVRAPDGLALAYHTRAGLLFDQSGAMPAGKGDTVLFNIGQSITAVPPTVESVRDRFYMLSGEGLDHPSITGERAVTIDGLYGFQIVGSGHHLRRNAARIAHLTMLFDGGYYFLMYGMADRDADAELWLARFDEAASSFRRR